MAAVVREKTKKVNRNRIISVVILICSICCLIYCGSVIYNFVIEKRENSKLEKEQKSLALKYEYYKTVLEHDNYKIIVQEKGYCYEVGTNKTYKCG